MNVVILPHARKRMAAYSVSEAQVFFALKSPDSVVSGHSNRLVAQKRLNSRVLRVVFEQKASEMVVVTVYKARADRYEV